MDVQKLETFSNKWQQERISSFFVICRYLVDNLGVKYLGFKMPVSTFVSN